MIPAERWIAMLSHTDAGYRQTARFFLCELGRRGPLTAEQLIRAADQNDGFAAIAWDLEKLPHTEASYQRMMAELMAGADEELDYELQCAFCGLELPLVRAHQEIFSCERLVPHVRDHLLDRVLLWREPTPELWDRLIEAAAALGDRCWGEFDERPFDRLIEAMARRPGMFHDRALSVICDAENYDWPGLMALRFLAAAPTPAAIPYLVNFLHYDDDQTPEESARALEALGTAEVVHELETAMRASDSNELRISGLYTLGKIQRPEAEQALLRLLDCVPEDLHDIALGELIMMGCSEAVPAAVRHVSQMTDDREADDIAQKLLALGELTGTTMPESEMLRARASQLRRGTMDADTAAFRRAFQNHWRQTGIRFERSPAEEEPRDDYDEPAHLPPLTDAHEITMPIRRETPKVGRNEPCPCGSGKKYKKCCLGTEELA